MAVHIPAARSRLLHLRREHPALAVGDLVIVDAREHLLAYRRVGFEEEFLVVLDMGDSEEDFRLPTKGRWRSVYGREGTIAGRKKLTIAARSAVVLKRVSQP